MNQSEDKIKHVLNHERFHFSKEQKRNIESLMSRAGGGSDDARKELIQVLRPYVENYVNRMVAERFGNADEGLVKTVSEKIINRFLSKDNYQDTLEQAQGKWIFLIQDIRDHIRGKFSRFYNGIGENDNIQFEDKMRLMYGRVYFSEDKIKRTESLMQHADDGNDDARKELIQVLRPYIEEVVEKITIGKFGQEKIDKSLVQTESEKVIERFLSRDNYPDRFKHAGGKLGALRNSIFLHIYHEFNTTDYKAARKFKSDQDNFYSYLKEEERGKIYELIQKINAGDDNARGELVGIIKPYVEKAAKKIARVVTDEKIDSDMVSEAVTNALYKSLLKRRKGSENLSVGSLQEAITYHLYRQFEKVGELQKESRYAEREFLRHNISERDSSFNFTNHNDSPEKDLTVKQVRSLIKQVLDNLPPDKKDIIESRYLKDMDLGEIAEQQNCSRRNIQNIEQRAIDDLQKIGKSAYREPNKIKDPRRRQLITAMQELRSNCFNEGEMPKNSGKKTYRERVAENNARARLRPVRIGNIDKSDDSGNYPNLPSLNEIKNLSNEDMIRLIRELGNTNDSGNSQRGR